MNADQILAKLEEANSTELSDDDDKWTDLQNEAEEGLPFDSFTQDQLVHFLKLTRELAWDIPSALSAVCSHLDMDEYYFMHRIPKEEAKKSVEKYGEGGYHPASVADWEPADKHFKEVHGWDMNDERINWEFDT